MATSARKTVIRNRKAHNKTSTYAAKGVEASRLRQRKHQLVRRFGIPDHLLGGSLNLVKRKCGKPTCRCAAGQEHPMWTLTYSVEGSRRVEFIPDELVPMVEPLAREGRAYREALNEILAINAQLMTLWRKEQRARPSRQLPSKKKK